MSVPVDTLIPAIIIASLYLLGLPTVLILGLLCSLDP